MVEHKTGTHVKTLVLPAMVASPADASRLLRELETVGASLMDQDVRDSKRGELPKLSSLLEQAAGLNKLDLLEPAARTGLQQFLKLVHEKAPVIHMSFSADPDAKFIEALMVYLRKEIHPQVLLTIGLRPSIGAGCTVRTTNKYFDFSLRQDLDKKRDQLLASLETATQPQAQPQEVRA
ncbi:MAG TPA: hypothetical protein VK534_01230 [Methylomirabilota bacterium]|nr:hypothetical protein [Methylomirabilota bacterium]